MEKHGSGMAFNLLGSVWVFLRKCLLSVLSFGPIPNHIAFIMDGNRRFAKSKSTKQDTGHNTGFAALVSALRHCYEMGVQYVTVYAFSIDNFKRNPDEVQSIMELMREKIDELLREESIVEEHGIRINFWGNLYLLSEPVRLAFEEAMATTRGNTGPVLSVCVAYTSTDEIVHAVQGSIAERRDGVQGRYGNGHCNNSIVSVGDLERKLYTDGCPDPDIVIRTSGETRLSNFLLWQTTSCHLQSPAVLWPEFTLRHLVWAVLEYQKVYPYLQERKKHQSVERH